MFAYQVNELVVVTGGAGFIGSHVVEMLLEKGCRVAVLDDFSTGKYENIRGHCEVSPLYIYECDITRDLWSVLAKVTQEHGPVDKIVHLAAQTSVAYSILHPLEDLRVNYFGTLQVLEYARTYQVKKVVFASSAAVYGDLEQPCLSESDVTRPISPYGIHKLSGEHLLSHYSRNHGLSVTAFRFFNVYGPRQDPKSDYSGVISIFLERALSGKDITIFGDGGQTRDFIYVKDLARTLVQCALTEAGDNSIFNLGTGQATSILDLAKKVLSLCGGTCSIEFKAPREGDIVHSCANVSLAKELLDFEAMVQLSSGLAETIQWLRNDRAAPVAILPSGSYTSWSQLECSSL